MAETSDKRNTYPSIPNRNWWELRQRFRLSPPRQVTRGYLQSVLNLSEGAAKNLIPPLRAVGLIDDDGKPTSLAHDWRDDQNYATVCRRILESAYPQELLDAHPGPTPDLRAVVRWFARATGTGEKNAQKMASFYVLLSQADPTAQDASLTNAKMPQDKPKGQSGTRKTKATGQVEASPEAVVRSRSKLATEPMGIQHAMPSFHINIQIHIPADARPEQIEQIFASMAKHLYGRST